jgi:hypothetical protein
VIGWRTAWAWLVRQDPRYAHRELADPTATEAKDAPEYGSGIVEGDGMKVKGKQGRTPKRPPPKGPQKGSVKRPAPAPSRKK